MFDYLGETIIVIDGDTIRLDLVKEIDVGFGIVQTCRQRDVRLRLAGLDAKPLKTPEGDAAQRWLDEALSNAKAIRVVTVKNALGEDKHEKYGRYLAYLIRVDSDGEVAPTINESMIAAGYAHSWDGRGPHPT